MAEVCGVTELSVQRRGLAQRLWMEEPPTAQFG